MSRKVLVFMLTVALVTFCGVGVNASCAEDIVTVGEEVVTGSRIYTSLEEVPAATYVIDREEIEKSGASKVSEVLDKVPGIFTRTRAGNTQDEFIEMRGLTTELLILVDGIPYHKSSHLADAAAVDLRSLPLEQVERIEVVKGAGSALYGSMAAAGVINIITRRPDQAEFAVTGETGTYDWRRGAFWASAPGERVDVSAWFSHSEEGESPLLFYSKTTEEGTSSYENRNMDYSNDSGGFTLSGGPLDFSATWGTYSSKWTYGAYDQSQDNDFSRFSLTWAEGPNRFVLYRDEQNKDLVQDSDYGPSDTTVDDQAWGAEYTRRTSWGDNLVSWGLAFRDEEMDYNYSDYTIYKKSRTNYAPFVEVSAPVGEMLLDLGLRYENWDQDDAKDYDEVIPKLSLSYQAMNGNLWYLSAGRFFAMPSLYQLSYFDNYFATEPNMDLKPEDGYSYELGCKGEDEKGNWNVGLFYLEMDDKIDIAPDWSTFVNIDEFRSWGIEASRGWAISPRWNFNLGLTWMNAEEKSAGGDWIRGGTPRWDIDATLAYAEGPLRGEMTLRYLGDREDERDGIGELSQDDVTTVDAMLQYETKAGTFRLSGYNIFDEDYYLQDYTNFGTTTRYYGPEQRVYLTWEYRF